MKAHPLDPLCASEISRARTVIELKARQGHEGAQLLFSDISLKEPTKEDLIRWKHDAGKRPPRLADAILQVLPSPLVICCTVNLDQGSVCSWREVPNVMPWATPHDCMHAEEVTKADEQFKQLLKQRYGVTDLDLVVCDPWSIHAMPEGVQGLKVMQCFIYLRSSPDDNQYAHPLDIVPFVDVLQGKVLHIDMHDTPPAINKEDNNYHINLLDPAKLRKDIKPLDVIQPQGPSFSVVGNCVTWCTWGLHVGFNAREGLVLSDISYEGRPVLYRMSLVEMAVPYADPREPYVRKCAFDVGDYGLGYTAISLDLGCDCLGAIHYFDTVFSNSRGEPVPRPKVVCMHEEDVGLAWKHVEYRTGHNESRRRRRLVISSISTVVNYEYCFYYYLYLDGTIEVEIKLTGELSTNVLSQGEEHPEFGTLVMPNVNAQHHQHMFCARIDPSPDDLNGGRDVVITEVNCEPLPPGPNNPFANAFEAKEHPLLSVHKAQRVVNPATHRTWKMTNPKVLNPITHKPVAYKLIPHASPPLMAHHTDSLIARRAHFATKNLWVTPYHPDQRFPAGDFVLNEKTCHGLSQWTMEDASLEGKSPCIWYAFGVTHVVRIEDFPVMPVESVGFILKPVGFFTGNPALDVPPAINTASVQVCGTCTNDTTANGTVQSKHNGTA